MRKGLIMVVLLAVTTITLAQKHNIVNASIALRNENYAEAKKYIDEAYESESTANEPKMWNYRAPIYLQIALKEPALDKDAAFKATEAHIKCLQKDKKGRVVVRKWTSEEDILAGLTQCGHKLFNIGVEKYNKADYKGALKCYDAIFVIIPLDSEDQLKRSNITKETLYMNSYLASRKLKDNDKSKELLQQLIDINYNEPRIYAYMSNIFFEEGDTDKALEYLASGREMFEDDQGLINDEINLYIKLNRKEELIAKLTSAIEMDPENEVLLDIRGTVYYNSNDFQNSEKDFRSVLEINPNSFNANSILGAILVNYANVIIEKSNNTNDHRVYEKLRKEAEDILNNSLPYLEKAFDIDPKNKENINLLKQIYYKVGDYKKSEEIKKFSE